MALPTLIAFVAGQDALAEDVNTNFDRIVSSLGALTDENISRTAAIKGWKLASAEGDQVPERCLGNNAVSARVLQSDVSAGAPLAAVSTAAHIKDGIITAAKLVGGIKPILVSKAFSLAAVRVASNFGAEYVNMNLCGPGSVDVNYPVATWDLIDCYVVNFNYVTGTLWSVSAWADSSQTNWRGWVTALGSAIGTGSGTMVFVFQAKP
jgi:hypothetical protein